MISTASAADEQDEYGSDSDSDGGFDPGTVVLTKARASHLTPDADLEIVVSPATRVSVRVKREPLSADTGAAPVATTKQTKKRPVSAAPAADTVAASTRDVTATAVGRKRKAAVKDEAMPADTARAANTAADRRVRRQVAPKG